MLEKLVEAGKFKLSSPQDQSTVYYIAQGIEILEPQRACDRVSLLIEQEWIYTAFRIQLRNAHAGRNMKEKVVCYEPGTRVFLHNSFPLPYPLITIQFLHSKESRIEREYDLLEDTVGWDHISLVKASILFVSSTQAVYEVKTDAKDIGATMEVNKGAKNRTVYRINDRTYGGLAVQHGVKDHIEMTLPPKTDYLFNPIFRKVNEQFIHVWNGSYSRAMPFEQRHVK